MGHKAKTPKACRQVLGTKHKGKFYPRKPGRCLCGNPAIGFDCGAPICQRCRDIEARLGEFTRTTCGTPDRAAYSGNSEDIRDAWRDWSDTDTSKPRNRIKPCPWG